MAYASASNISSFQVAIREDGGQAKTFASDLCVVSGDVMDEDAVDMAEAEAAALFDINDREVLYSKNAHERLYPASLTKVMTALVALQNASPDQVLTATDAVKITESGAQLCGLKAGDTMTLDQEYKRDLSKGMNPKIPIHYYPGDDPTKKPIKSWRCHANTLYFNWLNYYVYQVTPYQL